MYTYIYNRRVLWGQQGERCVGWCIPAVFLPESPLQASFFNQEINIMQCLVKAQPGLQMPNSQQ